MSAISSCSCSSSKGTGRHAARAAKNTVPRGDREYATKHGSTRRSTTDPVAHAQSSASSGTFPTPAPDASARPSQLIDTDKPVAVKELPEIAEDDESWLLVSNLRSRPSKKVDLAVERVKSDATAEGLEKYIHDRCTSLPSAVTVYSVKVFPPKEGRDTVCARITVNEADKPVLKQRGLLARDDSIAETGIITLRKIRANTSRGKIPRPERPPEKKDVGVKNITDQEKKWILLLHTRLLVKA